MDVQLEKKRGIKKKHIPYILAGVLFLIFIGMAIFSSNRKSYKVDIETLNISDVKEGEFNEYIRISGRVVPKVTVQLTPLEGGIVDKFFVEEGAIVKKGDPIISLINSGLNLNILDTEASLAEKENFLRNTRVTMEQEKLNLMRDMAQYKNEERRNYRKYKQFERLVKEELVSNEEFTQAKEDYELARQRRELIAQRQIQDSIYRTIQIDNLENSLRNMNRNMALTYERLENLIVKSPIDGQLGSLDVVLGQNVTLGLNIGQINDLSSYKIQANISEHYIDRVSQGLPANFDRNNITYNLEVTKVYPEVAEGNFKTDLVFNGEIPENIRTGQTYYINLQTGMPDKAVYISRGSFFQTTGGSWIFVVSKDGNRAIKREIKIGRQNPLYYEVTEGLKEGEKVITSSYELYGDSDELILN